MNKLSEDFIPIDKGSGMILLPLVMSKGSLWNGKSPKWLQIWYDIATLLLDKLMEQFI